MINKINMEQIKQTADVMLRKMDKELIAQAKSRAALERVDLRDWVSEAIRKALKSERVVTQVRKG